MGSTSILRSRRRSAGERQALISLERKIRSIDSFSRRKYLRDFHQAFSSYQSVLPQPALESKLLAADVILLSDYHALPACQRYAGQVIKFLVRQAKPVALALEAFLARDQELLRKWQAGGLEMDELRQRTRFDAEWGYPWQPIAELLQTARANGIPVHGIDCLPRSDLRTIAARDRHAAAKIAELRQAHPTAAVVALFGESHLAPNHLPQELRQLRSPDSILTVLQNVDSLYWQAAGERMHNVHSVAISQDAVCVFNATPLEKYESYRICLERWQQTASAKPGLQPTFENLLDSLLHFLSIEKYSSHNGTQPRFLIDLLPQVHLRASLEQHRGLLRSFGLASDDVLLYLRNIEARGSCYVSEANAILVQHFSLIEAAEDLAQFLHQACRGELRIATTNRPPADVFYLRALEQALAYFGSRVLSPTRSAMRESDLYSLYSLPEDSVLQQTLFGHSEFLRMLDFLVLHKDFELNGRQYYAPPVLIAEGVSSAGTRLAYLTGKLGCMLGTQLFDAYVDGRISKRFIRSLYFRKLNAEGAARQTYFEIARRTATPRRVAA